MAESSQSYRRSVPVDWLRSPIVGDKTALLEYARGVVYSLSTTVERRVKEIHVSRIRHAFSKVGEPSLYRVGLRLLTLFREIEPLWGGYWLLAPFRVVEVESRFLFVGAVPLAHGHLGSVTNEGLGRFISEDVAVRFPHQSIESWVGIGISDPATLVAAFRKDHRRCATPTIDLPDLEFLKFTKAGSRLDRQFIWALAACPALADDRIAICRQRYGDIYRYFSADLRDGKTYTEAPIEPSFLPRLIYALSSCSGTPVMVHVQHGSSVTEVTVPERLPLEEYRLALLLSKGITRRGNRSTYVLAPHLAAVLLRYITSLGCVLEFKR